MAIHLRSVKSEPDLLESKDHQTRYDKRSESRPPEGLGPYRPLIRSRSWIHFEWPKSWAFFHKPFWAEKRRKVNGLPGLNTAAKPRQGSSGSWVLVSPVRETAGNAMTTPHPSSLPVQKLQETDVPNIADVVSTPEHESRSNAREAPVSLVNTSQDDLASDAIDATILNLRRLLDRASSSVRTIDVKRLHELSDIAQQLSARQATAKNEAILDDIVAGSGLRSESVAALPTAEAHIEQQVWRDGDSTKRDDTLSLPKTPTRPTGTSEPVKVLDTNLTTLADRLGEITFAPALVIMEATTSSESDILQVESPYEESSGRNNVFRPSNTSSVGSDLDCLQDVFDDVPATGNGPEADVHCIGNQFQWIDSDIGNVERHLMEPGDDDIQIEAKREHDLASVMKMADSVSSQPTTSLESFLEPELVPRGAGQRITCWLLHNFTHSWLEFVHFLSLPGLSRVSEQLLSTIGYVQYGLLIRANWFCDGTLELSHGAQSSGQRSIRPSISSVSDDVPRYMVQVYKPESDQGSGKMIRRQIYHSPAEPGGVLEFPGVLETVRGHDSTGRSRRTSITSKLPSQVFTLTARKDTSSTENSAELSC